MEKPNYVIVHAQNVQHLQTLVNEGIGEGYHPIGGPFNGGQHIPPFGGIGQAMLLTATTPKPASKPTPKAKA